LYVVAVHALPGGDISLKNAIELNPLWVGRLVDFVLQATRIGSGRAAHGLTDIAAGFMFMRSGEERVNGL
jgi:hypothetical protein